MTPWLWVPSLDWLRVDNTQVQLQKPTGLSTHDGGERVLRRWDCRPVHRHRGPRAGDLSD